MNDVKAFRWKPVCKGSLFQGNILLGGFLIEGDTNKDLKGDDRVILRNNVFLGSIRWPGYGRDLVGKIRYAIFDSVENTVEHRAIDGPLLPFDYASK